MISLLLFAIINYRCDVNSMAELSLYLNKNSIVSLNQHYMCNKLYCEIIMVNNTEYYSELSCKEINKRLESK